jgi:pyrrolidone-carboxylate peptidase
LRRVTERAEWRRLPIGKMVEFGRREIQVILLTAFAPFGPKGLVTGTNASQVVLDRVAAKAPGRFRTAILPARQAGLDSYRGLLQEGGWSGLLSMGETGGIGSGHVVLERVANIQNSPGLLPPMPWTGTEPSLFAGTAESARQGGRYSIGGYFCNQVYLEALTWAKQHNGVPVAFVHVPAVLGESFPIYGKRVTTLYEHYTDEVMAILRQMEAKAAGRPG